MPPTKSGHCRSVEGAIGTMSGQSISFIREFRLDDAPAEVVDQAKRCLLDLIGVAAAGSRLRRAGSSARSRETQFGGAGGLFLFDGRNASAAGAALANATTIDGFDAHDGHPLTKGHAGCGSLAGLLAFAGDGASISGAEALAHLIVGYEVAIRAGMALHATAAEYHTSGAWVSLGVAAIGARMLGLDRGGNARGAGNRRIQWPAQPDDALHRSPGHDQGRFGLGRDGRRDRRDPCPRGFYRRACRHGRRTTTSRLCGPTSARAGASGSNISGLSGLPLGAAGDGGSGATPARSSISAMPKSKRSRSGHSSKRAGSPRRNRAPPTRRNTACRFRLQRCWCGARSVRRRSMARRSVDPDILRLSRRDGAHRRSALFRAVSGRTLGGGRDRARRRPAAGVGPAVARGSADNPLSEREISEKFHGFMKASGLGDRARRIEDMVMTHRSRAIHRAVD